MTTQSIFVDEGFAWLVCACGFVCQMINASSWATFGIFYDEFVNNFPEDSAALAWAWSLMTTVWCAPGMFVGKATRLLGCKTVAIMGAVSGAVSAIGCSFSRDVTFLCLWYGLLIGFACCSIETSALAAVQQSFDKKRALANGLCSIGANTGIFIFPPLFRYLNTRYSWRGTFLIQSAIYLHVILAASLYNLNFKSNPEKRGNREFPAVEEERSVNRKDRENLEICKLLLRIFFSCDKKLIRNCNLHIFGMVALLYYFSQSTVLVMLVPRATSYGISPQLAALLMSYWAVAGVIGMYVSGWFADKWSRIGVCGLFVSFAGISAIAMFWVKSYLLLCIFAISYGFGTAGYFALSFPSVVDMIGSEKAAEGFGMMRTPAALVQLGTMPLIEWLIKITGSYDVAFILAGCTLCVAGCLCFGIYVSSRYQKRTTDQNVQHLQVIKVSERNIDATPVSHVTNL